MRASKLRQRIRVEKFVDNGSNIEYPKRSWVEHCSVWADVQDLSTRDALMSQQIGIALTARAVVRFSELTSGITYDMRILFEGVYYQINGNPAKGLGDRRTYINIELKEGLKEWRDRG